MNAQCQHGLLIGGPRAHIIILSNNLPSYTDIGKGWPGHGTLILYTSYFSLVRIGLQDEIWYRHEFTTEWIVEWRFRASLKMINLQLKDPVVIWQKTIVVNLEKVWYILTGITSYRSKFWLRWVYKVTCPIVGMDSAPMIPRWLSFDYSR